MERYWKPLSRRGKIGTSIAVAGLILTVVALLYDNPFTPSATPFKVGDHVFVSLIVFGWTVLPPIWFLAEWTYFAPRMPEPPATQLPAEDLARLAYAASYDRYKQEMSELQYTQTLSRTIWLAVVVVLGVLYGMKVSG